MKSISGFRKLIGASLLILTVALIFFTVSACAPAPVQTVPVAPVPTARVAYRDGFDWGWLGLLGLLGLAGLRGRGRRKETDSTGYREPYG